MTVSSKKIMNKMLDELQKAIANEANLSVMKVHLEKVHVLNELLLDEAGSSSVLLAEKVQTNTSLMQGSSTSPTVIEEQGSSIFDF